MANRRELLVGFGSLLAAPAIVRAASLMPVSPQPAIVEAPRLLYVMHVGKWGNVTWTEGLNDPTSWGPTDEQIIAASAS